MSSSFQQEVETQEALNNLHRRILEIETNEGGVGGPSEGEGRRIELMVTLSHDFQNKVDTFCTVNLWEKDKQPSIFNWPWTVIWQVENYQIWKRI